MEAARALLTGCRLQLGQRSFISVPLPSLSGQPRISLPSHPDSIWPVSGALPEVGHCVEGVGGSDRAGLPGDRRQGGSGFDGGVSWGPPPAAPSMRPSALPGVAGPLFEPRPGSLHPLQSGLPEIT